jgi:23S rRNA (pseudouridine1915-N3)-methyltransferase
MKFNFIWIGKPKHKYIQQGIILYRDRLKHYCKLEIHQIKDVKSTHSEDQKNKESLSFQKFLVTENYTVCLDENGETMKSEELSQFISKLQNQGWKNINFIIGGAYGFDSAILGKSNTLLSLSKMTLPHDLCRVLLLEQVYRAFTILRNEKYHHA